MPKTKIRQANNPQRPSPGNRTISQVNASHADTALISNKAKKRKEQEIERGEEEDRAMDAYLPRSLNDYPRPNDSDDEDESRKAKRSSAYRLKSLQKESDPDEEVLDYEEDDTDSVHSEDRVTTSYHGIVDDTDEKRERHRLRLIAKQEKVQAQIAEDSRLRLIAKQEKVERENDKREKLRAQIAEDAEIAALYAKAEYNRSPDESSTGDESDKSDDTDRRRFWGNRYGGQGGRSVDEQADVEDEARRVLLEQELLEAREKAQQMQVQISLLLSEAASAKRKGSDLPIQRTSVVIKAVELNQLTHEDLKKLLENRRQLFLQGQSVNFSLQFSQACQDTLEELFPEDITDRPPRGTSESSRLDFLQWVDENPDEVIKFLTTLLPTSADVESQGKTLVQLLKAHGATLQLDHEEGVAPVLQWVRACKQILLDNTRAELTEAEVVILLKESNQAYQL